MSNYNPYASALSVAASELTSEDAQQYYSIRAQQDIQAALVLIVQFGCFVYTLGQQCRSWVETLEQNALMGMSSVVDETVVIFDPWFEPLGVRAIAIELEPLHQLLAPPANFQPIALLTAAKVSPDAAPVQVVSKPQRSRASKASKGGQRSSRGRKEPGIASRKAPTLVRSSNGAMIPID